MEDDSPPKHDSLTGLLHHYEPGMPPRLAAATLARLLQREPRPWRRRQLIDAFAGRVEELRAGVACELFAVYVGEASVVVPSAVQRGKPSELKAARSVIRNVDPREVPIGAQPAHQTGSEGPPHG